MTTRRSLLPEASIRIETGGKDVEQIAAEAIESLGLQSSDDRLREILGLRRAK